MQGWPFKIASCELRRVEIPKIGDTFGCGEASRGATVKWMAALDSAHQIGPMSKVYALFEFVDGLSRCDILYYRVWKFRKLGMFEFVMEQPKQL